MSAVVQGRGRSRDFAGEARATFIAAHQFAPPCRTAPTPAVGAAEAELERLIRSAGEQMVAWYEHDHAVARHWLNQMNALIARRSPQRRAAMEAQIRHRIEDPCYFSSDEAHSLTGGLRG